MVITINRKMNRQSILLLHLLLAILSSVVVASDESKSMRANYEQINAYLVVLPQEQQEDVKVMMEKLDELTIDGGNDALREILALRLVEKDFNCQRKTFELLQWNDLVTGGLARQPYPTRPIDKIVRHYLLLRANRCQKVYLKRFKQIYHSKMEDKFLDQMDPFLLRIIERNLERNYEANFEQLKPWQLVEGLKWISRVTEEDAEVIYEELSKLAKLDPKNGCLKPKKGEFDENCLVELVNKYFSRTCEKYFVNLGPEVFEQAIFDDQLLHQPKAKDLSRFKYYLGWASYNLCNSIRQNELAVAQIFALGAE